MIILLVTVATSLVAYSDSAAMFPFSFRIPMSANDAKDVSSVIMVPAVGPISSDSKILRGLFDGFSFWAASQTANFDPIGESSSTSATSSLVSATTSSADDKLMEQSVEQAAEAPANEVVVDAEKLSVLAAVAPELAKSEEPVGSVVGQPAAETPASDPAPEAAPEAQASDSASETVPEVVSEAPASDPVPDIATEAAVLASDPAPVTHETPLSDPVPTTDAPVADAPATEQALPVSDQAESVAELVAEPAAETSKAAVALPEPEMDAVTEPASDAVVISAPEEPVSEAAVADELRSVASAVDVAERTSSSGNPTSYSATTGYLPGFNFPGYDMYSRPCPDPFTCGNIMCEGDMMCSHWSWIPTSGGTCYLKNNPGSGYSWATPCPTPGCYGGFIPSRTCPPALISICIYLDIIIQLPFISSLIG